MRGCVRTMQRNAIHPLTPSPSPPRGEGSSRDGRERPVDTQPQGAIARLTEELGKLPGIGPKTAERLTHHLLAADRETVLALADAQET